MKGMIFNQLEAMLTASLGPDGWDALVEQTELATAERYFVGPRNYPDQDLFALVATGARLTGLSTSELIHRFGRFLFPALASAYPTFIRPGMSAKSFLLTVDRVIHIEVHKLHPDALLPVIHYEDPAADQLVLLYHSPRRLCDLAVGLIEGAAAWFDEAVTHQHPKCLKRGDEVCRLECTFTR